MESVNNKMWKWISMFMITVGAYVYTTIGASAYDRDMSKLKTAFTAFFDEYRMIIGYITAIGLLTSILVFIYHMIQLANMASHPVLRRKTMTNIMISLICTALLGGMTVINFLFYEIIFGA